MVLYTSTKQFPYSARQLHATPQPQSIIIHSVGDRALVEGVATVTLSQGTLYNRNHIRNTLSLTPIETPPSVQTKGITLCKTNTLM